MLSESSRGRLGAALGLDEAAAKNVPQQALRRLQDADLVLRMDYADYLKLAVGIVDGFVSTAYEASAVSASYAPGDY